MRTVVRGRLADRASYPVSSQGSPGLAQTDLHFRTPATTLMPTIYRTMKRFHDGFPVAEPTGRGLGVRPPSSKDRDVDVDASGHILVNGRGMSVARHWRDLPAHRIPERLDDGELGASGSSKDACWRTGEGGFEPGPFAAGLCLALKSHAPVLGNVAPTEPISLQRFQAQLAATREGWIIDEE